MKISSIKTVFATALTIGFGWLGLEAQSVTNGGFDENLPSFSSTWFVQQNPTGWSSVIAVPYWIQSWDGTTSSAVFKVVAEEGAAFVGIQNHGTNNTQASGIFQAVTGLTVGETYTVSFSVRARNVASEGGTFTANISGGTAVILGSGSATSTGWTSFTGTFVAASTSANLGITFRSSSGDQMLFLDSVSISVIPEPSTSAMLIGSIMLGVCAMARRTAR